MENKNKIPKISTRDMKNVMFAIDNNGNNNHSEEVAETINNSIERFCTWMNESMEFIENDGSVKDIREFVADD